MTPITETTTTPTETPTPTRWTRPAVDLRQTDDGALVAYLDVPGVKRDAVELTVEDRALVVRAARSAAVGYRWVLELPDLVDPERIEARLADGVLEITLRRSARAEPRRIPVG